MNCWHCGTELIWGCDFDIESDDPRSEEFCMETGLSCPNCHALVTVLVPNDLDERLSVK